MPRDPLLKVEGIAKSFGRTQALRGVDLTVDRGEVVCIMGPSGCGKSTLLRCINFLEEPDQGLVYFDGQPIGITIVAGRRRRDKENRINRMRARIGMVFQQFNVWPHLTVFENVTKAPTTVLGHDPDAVSKRATDVLDRVGLAGKRDDYPGELSGDQLQRVAIARALAMEPELMLFDEPTSSLDPELVAEVLAVMRDMAYSGMAMIVVTHELGFARSVADRIIFMNDGRVEEEGPPEQVLLRPRTERLQRFLSQVLYDESFLKEHTDGSRLSRDDRGHKRKRRPGR